MLPESRSPTNRYHPFVARVTQVEVAVPLPVFETYSYRLDPGMTVEPGGRVLVPCGGRRVTGVVLSLSDRGGKVSPRSVVQVVDAEPVLPAPLLDVVLKAAHDALCPPGLALAAAIPPGTAPRPGRRVVLQDAGRRALDRGEARGELGKVLWSVGRASLPEAVLRKRFPDASALLNRLERVGWIRREIATEPPRVRIRTERVYGLALKVDLEKARADNARAPRRLELLEILSQGARPLPSTAPLRALIKAGLVVFEDREVHRGELPPALIAGEPPPVLTPHQREAVARIVDTMRAGQDLGFLLHGITGSGKTEVYLRAAEEALAQGRGVIVLVPEISLTHQIVDRFRERFRDGVAVLHSGLSGGERFDQWRRIREGSHQIVIGARSAVFAPVENPGLIVIDEEHDGAYKSDEGFRYHARDVAELRARSSPCPWVLGSATPDVTTFQRAGRGEIERLVLPERIASRPLPEVEIVDMNAAPKRGGRRALLSRCLRTALAETLAAGQQAILFLNRRGFATMSYCFSCGHALRCRHCDISLVYHASEGGRRPDAVEEGELRCHYCGYREEPSLICPSCQSPEGGLLGFGTERVEEEVTAMFPHARVGRLDRDTSARKGEQRRILAAFHRREMDVLVGTQMVAKGHDIPGVTLVGVIAADLGLHFPDFRAGERTFQLLTQVAGRAGRGQEAGRVVVQTFLPEHYAIALARDHDYDRFCREELHRRKGHGYPPFRDLVQLVLAGKDAGAVEDAARTLAQLSGTVPLSNSEASNLEVLGPAPAPVTRVRDRFRWNLLLLGDREDVRTVARELMRLSRRRFRGVSLRVDAGPLQML
jgi:primosomal protein N' (replication factor Y)